AYTVGLAIKWYVPSGFLPGWYSFGGIDRTLTWAGWWSALVSVPLFLILFFSWLWRILLWSGFLVRVSRMKLRLIAAHPDAASGLKFLNSELFAFMPLGFTLGVVAAGSVANRVLLQSASMVRVRNTVIGLLIFVVILFVGPMFAFVLKLHRTKIRGVFEYNQLADSVGREFERKWLANNQEINSSALEVPDFSAT